MAFAALRRRIVVARRWGLPLAPLRAVPRPKTARATGGAQRRRVQRRRRRRRIRPRLTEATAAIPKMISVLDAAEGARERLRAAHARAAETCASQLGFDAVLVELREIVPDAATSGACDCRLAC